MKRNLVSAAICLFLLTACDVGSPAEQFQYGFARTTVSGEPGAFTADPRVIFFLAPQGQVLESRDVIEGCTQGIFDPGLGEPTYRHINAGDSVTVTAGGSRVRLEAATLPGRTEYRREGDPPLPVEPNTVMNFATYGTPGGFPPMTHSIAAVRPPAVQAITITDDDQQNVSLVWANATHDQAVKMEFAFTWQDDLLSHHRLVCLFPDVGEGSIDWRDLVNLRRGSGITGTATRFRSTFTGSGTSVFVALVVAERLLEINTP